MAAAISVYIATLQQHRLASGEIGHVLLIAASRDQASVAFAYVLGFLKSSPLLRQQIVSETASEVRLKGNIVIGVHAGSYRTIRGRTLFAVVGDETSFWRSEESALPDVEVYRAVLPALAASKGLWVGISTGYRKLGLLYQKWRDHFGQNHDDVLAIQGPSRAFNATLDQTIIDAPSLATPRRQKQSGKVSFAPTYPVSSMMRSSSAALTTHAHWRYHPDKVSPTLPLQILRGAVMIISVCALGTAKERARAAISWRMSSAVSLRPSTPKV